ncbi:hypothetical protein ACTNDP_01690 [Paenibacillus barengoltzii]|uniref:hypothetical protein n=1 Tax=Paenibacillus TaxID=44249 RepID=UPI0028FD1E0A|nr:hypothetical protein [Paenibacillus sp. 3LSP]MDU0332873.1 hypothetical protein [Paenibacillus sp. 3LSP]
MFRKRGKNPLLIQRINDARSPLLCDMMKLDEEELYVRIDVGRGREPAFGGRSGGVTG